MAEWFYRIDQEQRWPVTEADLRELLARGELQSTHFVWRAGVERWQRIEQTELGAAGSSALLSLEYAAPAPTAPTYANFGDRLLAWVIDYFVVAGIRIGA